MRTDKYFCAFLLYVQLFVFAYSEKNESIFIATNKWQIVKQGTLLPKGLHIRHNMQTKLTEAKLMDQEKMENKSLYDFSSNAMILHSNEEVKSEDDGSLIKEHFKDLKFSINDNNQYMKPNLYVKVPKTFTGPKTLEFDKELFNSLFNKFIMLKNTMNRINLPDKHVKAILEILNSLEHVIHHIDGGRLFTDMGGLSKIVLPCLNTSHNNIRAEALKLLGAAVNLNPEVQVKALEYNLIDKVLNLLTMKTNSLVKKRCIYALGALIRNFPTAQKSFLDYGGIYVFVLILSEENEDLELKCRTMKLVNDLITERQGVGFVANLKEYKDKADEYAATNFKNKLITQGYCQNLMNLMIRVFKQELKNPTNIENYEFLEVIIESMIRISKACKDEFHKNQREILKVINELVDFFEELSKHVDSKSIALINKQIMLVERLMVIIEIPVHDEL
ncbi:hypothetical protein M0802_012200 [Mischocyttarus mexicanus]|nr:hypothetical protein M0802_012200 [Mischocyttarus mexicanus]